MRLALSINRRGARLASRPFEIAAFCLLWSSAFSISKVALAGCPPLLLLTARFLLAAAILLGGALVARAEWRLRGRDVIVLALIGVANNALYLGFNYTGMQTVSSGLTALISSLNPVLTAVFAAGLLGEPMTWRKAFGLVLGLCGVAFIVESRLHGGAEGPFGIGLVVAGLVSLVCGTILFKLFAPRGGLWIANGIQSLAGGLTLVPIAFTFESVGDIVPSWRLLAALGYLVFCSVFAYLLWFRLLTVFGATAASAYYFLMPPLGLLFGWLVLTERVELGDLAGIVPVALGIYLVTRPAAAAPRAALVHDCAVK